MHFLTAPMMLILIAFTFEFAGKVLVAYQDGGDNFFQRKLLFDEKATAAAAATVVAAVTLNEKPDTQIMSTF